MQTLSDKLLENLASHNVADAFRYFAGTQMKDYGGLKTVDNFAVPFPIPLPAPVIKIVLSIFFSY